MQNLESLGFPCKNIFVFRTRMGTANFGDKVLKDHGNRHEVFHNLEDALAQKPDIVFITNPTSLHIPVALRAAKAGCHLFIEKPLSHQLKGVDTLIKIVEKEKIFAFVAYNLRFHPFLGQIKRWLASKKIGEIMSIRAEMSERITDWHNWEDFKIGYGARKDLGGGAVLSQCHELDYLCWLFGMPQWVFAAGGELGDLEIGVEDTSESIIGFENNIIASLHVDYLKRPHKGSLEISGTKGRIYWDYFNGKLNLIPIEGNPVSKSDSSKNPRVFERAATFIEGLKYFLSCIRKNEQPMPDLIHGKNILKVILATKKSLATRRVVRL